MPAQALNGIDNGNVRNMTVKYFAGLPPFSGDQDSDEAAFSVNRYKSFLLKLY